MVQKLQKVLLLAAAINRGIRKLRRIQAALFAQAAATLWFRVGLGGTLTEKVEKFLKQDSPLSEAKLHY